MIETKQSDQRAPLPLELIEASTVRSDRLGGAATSERDTTEDDLCAAAHDAFMAFWRAAGLDDTAALWLAYSGAQARYDNYLEGKELCLSALVERNGA